MDITSGQILLAVLVVVLFAPLVSIGLLSLYRRAVLRSMQTRATSDLTMEPMPGVGSTAQHQQVQASVPIVVMDENAAPDPGRFARDFNADLRMAPRRAAAVYAFAGLCCTIVLTTIFFISSALEFLPFRFFVFVWLYVWPVFLTIIIVSGTALRQRFLPIAAYFFVLAGLEILGVIRNPDLNFGAITFIWILLNFPVIFLNRRVRAVGPLVLILMILAVTGVYFAFLIAVGDIQMLESIVQLGLAVGLSSDGIFIAILVLGIVPFIFCGWLMIQWIGYRYNRKKISDQSITLDAIWLFYTAFASVDFMTAGAVWLIAWPMAFLVYKVVALVGFSFYSHKIRPSKKSSALLLLRVFSLGKRSERLFDAVSTNWRYIGDIRFIAGPDLMTATVEPHEFLDFISGKLSRRFIDNAQLLDLRISEMDLNPDFDGRFRVNDFFCRDDTWRMVLSRLISECDVVLMDIRGFSAQNSGCIFEINELINIVPLGRVVFVIDDTTDEAFLRQIIQQSWSQMRPASPNRVATPESLRLFRLTRLRPARLQKLLETLSVAANPVLYGR